MTPLSSSLMSLRAMKKNTAVTILIRINNNYPLITAIILANEQYYLFLINNIINESNVFRMIENKDDNILSRPARMGVEFACK